MSNVDGENPEFDDSDLGELEELDGDQPDASEETFQFDEPGALPELEPGALPELEPTEDLLEPDDETVETDEPDEPIEPDEEGFAADAEGLAPVEVKTEEEEEPEEEEEKSPGLLTRLSKTSPYVVLLGISLVAILIGILCLWMEFRRYDYQRKPPQVGAVPAVQSGPPSTTATA